VEFGYKTQVVDNADGIILDHIVEIGNPADAPQLAPAIARITERAGRVPTAVTADRGYGYAAVEADLHHLGARRVAIPRASQPSAARREFEHRKACRTKVKWRTGCEGRINHLKRGYGWNRDQVRGLMKPTYHGSPVGALLVWETPGNGQAVRGGTITAGPEQLLLDGQQRVTRLYGIVRGRAPSFFKGEFNVATASGAA